MKKLIALLLALVMVLALTACDRRRSRSRDDDDDDDETTVATGEHIVGDVDDDMDYGENSGSTPVVRPLPDDDEDEPETPTENTTEAPEAQKSPVEALFGNAALKTHTVQEMSIELPDVMWESNNPSYTALFDSTLAAVYVLREDFNTAGIDSSWTATEYAQAVVDANSAYEYSNFGSGGNGWVTTEYTTGDFQFCCAMYKGENAFWLLQFVCQQQNTGEMIDYFEQWLDSVEFN